MLTKKDNKHIKIAAQQISNALGSADKAVEALGECSNVVAKEREAVFKLSGALRVQFENLIRKFINQ